MKRGFLDEVGDAHVVAAARIAFGLLLLVQAWENGTEQLREGFFGEHFHYAFIPERFVPSERTYALILCLQAVAGVLVLLGHFARPALFFSALAITYAMLCDRLHFHHNRWALACYAFLLSFTPCDRARALGLEKGAPSFTVRGFAPDTPKARLAALRSASLGPLWAQRLAMLQVSIIYLASGGSKLVDKDWRSGQVLFDRMVRYGQGAIDRGVPERVVAFFQQENVASLLAKGAIATELFLAFALQTRRLRIPAIFLGLCFHLAIETTSRVELFSFTTFAAYFLFATPDLRARTLRYDPTRRKAVALAWVVRSLDWLARFDVAPWQADGLSAKRSFVVTDRDGAPRTRFPAVMTLMRALPLTFPIWAILYPFAVRSKE